MVSCASVDEKPRIESNEPVQQEAEAVPAPPNVALDANNLQDLLTTQFALRAGDWDLAAQSAFKSAQSTQDYRLARLATGLSDRAKRRDLTQKSAQLWYQLDGSPVAKNAWIAALLKNQQTTRALELLDENLAEKLEEALTDQNTQEAEVNQEGFTPKEAIIAAHIKSVSGLVLAVLRTSSEDVAMQVMHHYVQKYPEHLQVLLSAAYVANHYKQFELAQKWADIVSASRPGWDALGQVQAKIYQSQNKAQIRSDYIATFVQTYPETKEMRFSYASHLIQLKKYKAALEQMQYFINQGTKDAQVFTLAGSLAIKLGMQEQGVDYYITALELDASNDEVRWELARLAEQAENYRQAEKYYRAMSQENYRFSAHLRLASILYNKEGLQAGLDALDGLNPITQENYISKALLHHYFLTDSRRFEEAYGYINEALVYLPDNLDFLYSRALLAAELEDVETAENDLRHILSRQPNNPDALNALGYTLADLTGRYEEAKELIEKAVQLRPDAAHILDSMGWVLYRLGENQRAIVFLQKAYNKEALSEIAAHLGEVFWENGEREKAIEIWQDAYRKDAEDRVLRKTLRKYKVLDSVQKTSVKQ